jgi:hypothetical protein
MSKISIPVSVELVSNLAEQVRQQIGAAKAAMGGASAGGVSTPGVQSNGSPGINTANDIRQLNSLNAAAKQLEKALAAAAKQGLEIDVGDTSALEEAIAALEELAEKQKDLNVPMGGDLSQSLKDIERYKRSITNLDTLQKQMAARRSKVDAEETKRLKNAQAFADRVARGRATSAQARPVADYLRNSPNPVIRNAARSGEDPELAVRAAAPSHRAAEAVLEREANRVREGTGVGFVPQQQQSGTGKWAKRLAGAAGGAAAGMLSGGGGAGSAVAGALGAAAGAIPFVGPALGPIVGGAAGAVAQHMDNAYDEAVDTSTLRHSLGDASIEFDRLRDKTREATRGMGILDTESVKFAQHFAHTANLGGKKRRRRHRRRAEERLWILALAGHRSGAGRRILRKNAQSRCYVGR